MSDRAKARWKAIGWTVAFFVSAIVATFAVGMILGRTIPGVGQMWLQTIAQVVGFGVATWLIGRVALKYGWSELRYMNAGPRLKGFGVGLAVGAVPALVAMGIAAPAGHAGWSLDGGTFAQWAMAVGGLGALLLPAALSEEMLFRGVGYVALTKEFGRVGPAVVLSLLFGAAHFHNPNVTDLAVANIAIAGMFLSAAFWLPGGMYAAVGAHFGWNITLAAFGAPVSGIPFTLPMLDYATGGPRWLTGAEFGPEGGAIATVVVAVATVVVYRWTTQKEAVGS